MFINEDDLPTARRPTPADRLCAIALGIWFGVGLTMWLAY